MALQEPVLRAVGLAFRLAVAPRFPDVRGSLTDVFIDFTGSREDWFWDSSSGGPPLVSAWDDERRLFLVIGPQRLDVVSEAPDVDVAAEAATQVVGPCLDLLGLSEAAACAASATWTLAAEKSADAEQALEDWIFHPELRSNLGALGGRPDDLSFEASFASDGEVFTDITAEPVTDEEASDGPFFLSDMDVDEFPPGALIVRVERRQDQAVPSAECVGRSAAQLNKLLELSERLLATVGARDDAS